MVRSIGIDPGDRMAHVVALDGSYRRTRLLQHYSAPIGAGDDPMRPDVVAEAVREGIDAEGMRGDITLGYPCREAVLRTIELPFKGEDAIRKVVKSEIEGEIYTHSVDDMVVDFHEVGAGADGETRVLVAAVPKLGLRNQLTSLSAHGVDPETVDLDTMALWRAASWAGVLDTEDVDEDGKEPVHAVVDLGARSVKVILTEGDELVEMRVLRLGDSVVADQIARHHGLLGEQAMEAVAESLRTGSDVRVDVAGGAAPDAAADSTLDTTLDTTLDNEFVVVDGADEDGDAPAEADAEIEAEGSELPAPVQREVELVPYDEVDAAHSKYLKRLGRELTRFLTASGMAARVRTVWVSGSACRGRGVAEMLTDVFGVEPQELDVLANCAHDLDEADAAELSPQMAIAFGLALGRLGGPEGFQLRREDLAVTGGFDRIKFPLAIVCLVGLLAMFVYGQTREMKLTLLELRLGQNAYDKDNPNAAVYHGMLWPIMQSNMMQDKQQFALKDASGKRIEYSFDDLVAELDEAPVHKRVQIVLNRLKEVAAEKQKETGIYEDVSLESGLAVLVRWAEVMESISPQLGRYLVPEIEIDMGARKRFLEFTCAFRGEDFRQKETIVLRAFQQEFVRRDSPFEAPESGSFKGREDGFESGDGPEVQGAYYTFRLDIRQQFPSFGPSERMGALDGQAAGRDLRVGALTQPARRPDIDSIHGNREVR